MRAYQLKAKERAAFGALTHFFAISAKDDLVTSTTKQVPLLALSVGDVFYPFTTLWTSQLLSGPTSGYTVSIGTSISATALMAATAPSAVLWHAVAVSASIAPLAFLSGTPGSLVLQINQSTSDGAAFTGGELVLGVCLIRQPEVKALQL